jgi:hypothetical protein
MANKSRVSVITSVYKSSDFLFDFFLDIKRQSIFSECEFIILDANEEKESKDFEIISKFLDLPNIKYKHIGKCSVYSAWNQGVKIASSDIITNWNTDDRRKWNSLDYQVSFLESNSEVDLCYGQLKISYIPNENFEDCNSNHVWPCFEGSIENQIKHNSPHCMPVWRKDMHDKFGLFDESLFSASDYDMWFRVLVGKGVIKKLDEFVGVYFSNEKSISRNPNTLREAVNEVMQVKSKYQKFA